MFKKIIQLITCILSLSFVDITAQSKICIIIPAYNEASRIEKTITHYANYFASKPEQTTFVVVANNCSDNTVDIVKQLQKTYFNLDLIDLKPGGKGFAIKQGFLWALGRHFDLIGFVDADMATQPQYFYDLVLACKNADGAIASRYAKGANVQPERPWLKKLGGKFYNWLLRKKMHLSFKDTQCGAKIFTYDTINQVAHRMTETGWSFDLELLYLCHLVGKKVKEIPTTWSDQPGSHLTISSKLMKEFLNAPTRIKQRHAEFKKSLKTQKFARTKKPATLK